MLLACAWLDAPLLQFRANASASSRVLTTSHRKVPTAVRSCKRVRVSNMRAVVQRVKSANVSVDGNTISSIGAGLLCLVGVGKDDGEEDAEYICRKMMNIRLWPNETDRLRSFDRSVLQTDYGMLLVSQFTLFGRLKGNKLDFSHAMSPSVAKEQYAQLVQRCKDQLGDDRVKDGVFGAMMDVSLVNDGPVTINLDSKSRE